MGDNTDERGRWHNRSPARGKGGEAGAAPHAPAAHALKCFTKAAVAAPALAFWGKKEEEEEEEEGDREVYSAVPEAGSSLQARALLEDDPGAEDGTGKDSWVPFGRCQCSLSHQGHPPGPGRCQLCHAGKGRARPSSLAWLREGSGGSLQAPRRAAGGTGELTAPKNHPGLLRSK